MPVEGGGGGGGVFPAGIDRCLFVFAMGPDSINPARVTIIPPPCQRVSVSERERGHRGGRQRRWDEKDEWGGGGVVKRAFSAF